MCQQKYLYLITVLPWKNSEAPKSCNTHSEGTEFTLGSGVYEFPFSFLHDENIKLMKYSTNLIYPPIFIPGCSAIP